MDSTLNLLEKAQNAFKTNKPHEAAEWLHKVLSQDPENHLANYILGLIAAGDSENGPALKYLEKAASLCSDDPKIFYNYGLVLQRTAQYNKAINQYEKALSLDPDYIQVLNNYSAALLITGELTKAEAAARKIINIDPSHVDPHVNLGNILKDGGFINEALESYNNALTLQPDNVIAGSNMLLCMCYSTHNAETIFNEHRAWEHRISKSSSQESITYTDLDPDKSPLRIGYISADFKTHSVAFYIEQILENHDPSQFEIFCYSDVQNPDPVTLRLKKLPMKWRPISGMDNDKVLEIIRKDDIDTLVDLSGHAGKNRLPLFLLKAAPLQINYLGYPNTTGLSQMDYRLTDSWADPDGQEKYYTENLYHLPQGFLCYKPSKLSPPVSEIPAAKNGFITFGSFNNLPKVSIETIDVWAKILKAIEQSRLMIKTKPFNDASVKERYKNLFAQKGVDIDRLLFTEYSPSLEKHLSFYHHVDIGLDTFPYNGTTTTCEALWMGVPVITLAGDHHRGRVGVSIMSRIGLTGMVADSTERYIALALFLASDLERLSKLRLGLRSTLAQSPLCDGKSFTKMLEKAYREMWNDKVKSLE